MHPQDILYYCLAIAALCIAGSSAYVAVFLVQAIRSLKNVIDDLADVSDDIRETKDFLKTNVLVKLFELGKEFFYTKQQEKKRTRTHAHKS